ncbi:MAG: hypothetical protein IJL47_09475 [Lachnospiraceae bacterium]|nr:hypothetical protein [Lachnospiraceae bacterium]
MKYKLALLAKDMHNSVLPRTYDFYGKSLGHEVDFKIINVDENELVGTLEKMRSELHGFTVTMPYKVKIMEFCEELDISAEKCGSCNTVLIKNGKFIGYNTDGWGMVKCLGLKGYSFENKDVVLVGAGGVALSIAYNLSINKVKHVDVLNKFPNETERLLSRMDERFSGYDLTDEYLEKCCDGADCFINASILGQVGFDDWNNLDFLKKLKKDALIYDVNYSKPNAKLPQKAAELGFKHYVGKAMSACQGIRAMEIWTGTAPSDETARKLVELIENNH